MNFKASILNLKSLSLLARLAACVLIVACLTGCGQSLSGTYTGESVLGTVTVEFKGGHKAIGTVAGQMNQLSYTIENDKVIFDTGKGKEVYTIMKDGSLSRGMGLMTITLKKK